MFLTMYFVVVSRPPRQHWQQTQDKPEYSDKQFGFNASDLTISTDCFRAEPIFMHTVTLCKKIMTSMSPKKVIYYSGGGKGQKKKEWKKVTIRPLVS